MLQPTYTFAATEASEKGLFGALGIDWRLLILQVIAFAILVWLLGKFVYPPLIKAIDKREKAIADSVKAATEAEANAARTQQEIDELFKKARLEASEIIDSANKDAAATIKEAEDKAKLRGDQIIADARTQLDADIIKARKMLKEEAVSLVVAATERIVGEKIDDPKDAARIKEALQQERV